MKNYSFILAVFLINISFLSFVYGIFFEMFWLASICVALFILGIVLAFNIKGINIWKNIKEVLLSKQFRWHALQLRELSFVFIALFLIYAISLKFESEYSLDLTAHKLHSLSPRMKMQLEKLQSSIRIIYFKSDESSDFSAEEILKRLKATGKLEVEILDLANNYNLARKYEVSGAGEMLFFYKKIAGKNVNSAEKSATEDTSKGGDGVVDNNWELALKLSTKDFRRLRLQGGSAGVATYRYHALIQNALESIENRGEPKTTVVLLTAWNENRLMTAKQAGYESLQRSLKTEGMDWKIVSFSNTTNAQLLNSSSSWPLLYAKFSEGASNYKKSNTSQASSNGFLAMQRNKNFFLLVDGSRRLPPNIYNFLEAHFRSGGNMALLFEPENQTEKETNYISSGLVDFLATYGIASSGGQVVDVFSTNPYYMFYSGSSTPSPMYPKLFYPTIHPITASLRVAQLSPFFVGATSFYYIANKENIASTNFTPLVTSSTNAWAEKNYRAEKEKFGIPQFTLGVDSPPGKAIVGFLTNTFGGKALLVGDGDFLRESFFHLAGNRILLLNAIKYMLNPNANLALDEKLDDVQPVKYYGKEKTLFLFLFLFLLPLLCLLVGYVMAVRRKMHNRLV